MRSITASTESSYSLAFSCVYVDDGNGNVCDYIEANGTSVAHYEYGPFGENEATSGDKRNDFTHRFSTKPFEEETGLVRYELRDYSAELGRWLSSDPLQERGGQNLHSWCLNDGIGVIDVLGGQPSAGRSIIITPNLLPSAIELVRQHGQDLKTLLIAELISLCPSEGQTIMLDPAINKPQCCTGRSCREQAVVFADAYVDAVTASYIQELTKYGDVLGGTPGNERRHEGGVAGPDGRLCVEWSELAYQAFSQSLQGYFENHTGCFRGTLLFKGENVWWRFYDYHQWFGIYGPSRTVLALDADIQLDPWPSGGLYIHSSYRPTGHGGRWFW